MKCPHCNVEIYASFSNGHIADDTDFIWHVGSMVCPSCEKAIIMLSGHNLNLMNDQFEEIVYPKSTGRPPVPIEVDRHIAQDYTEACLVLKDSPKASAALSRRCLQNILREKAGVTKGDLSKEIQQVIDGATLPSHLKDSIDAIRNIGNYAAHPMKSTSSGEIIDVEPGEAEWSLDVLEYLFDFYYVQPTKIAAKRAALDAKLSDVGKPPMK